MAPSFVPAYDTGLWRVSAAGGAAQPVVSPETGKGERTFRWPVLLPGGRAVLFTAGSIDSPNDYDKARLVAFSLATGERRVVAEGVNMAGFVAPDTLVYSRAGSAFHRSLRRLSPGSRRPGDARPRGRRGRPESAPRTSR